MALRTTNSRLSAAIAAALFAAVVVIYLAWHPGGSKSAGGAGDPNAPKLPDTIVPFTLGTADLREAYRSLKGKVLREEVYADDGTSLAPLPYAVTEHRYEVRQLQPIDGERHGVYQPLVREDVGAHYERNAADPRVEHILYMEIDPLGHVRRDAQIGYARRPPAQPALHAGRSAA